jgi:hypothetical protein
MWTKAQFAELFFAAIGAAAFVSSWVMNFWLWKSMSTRPDVVHGFTVPMIIHGQTIYTTNLYDLIYKLLFLGGLGVFLYAVIVDFHKDPFN